MRTIGEIRQDLSQLDGRIEQLQNRAQAALQKASQFEAERQHGNVAVLLADPAGDIANRRREAEDLGHEAHDCETALGLMRKQRAALAEELGHVEFAVEIDKTRDLIAQRVVAGKEIAVLAEKLLIEAAALMKLDAELVDRMRPLNGRPSLKGGTVTISGILGRIEGSTTQHVLNCLAGRVDKTQVLDGSIPGNWNGKQATPEMDADLFSTALRILEHFSPAEASSGKKIAVRFKGDFSSQGLKYKRGDVARVSQEQLEHLLSLGTVEQV